MQFVKLDGWTRVGEKTSPTGRWTVYRFRGREFDEVTVLDAFAPSDEGERKATALFEKTKEGMKRGAAWLVAPDGTVKSLVFLRPSV